MKLSKDSLTLPVIQVIDRAAAQASRHINCGVNCVIVLSGRRALDKMLVFSIDFFNQESAQFSFLQLYYHDSNWRCIHTAV